MFVALILILFCVCACIDSKDGVMGDISVFFLFDIVVCFVFALVGIQKKGWWAI